MNAMMKKFLTRCCSCDRNTSKSYARTHAGKCKACAEPETFTAKPSRASAARRDADEAFREDHMGCSEDAYENRYGSNGGDY